jgi:hypothetical protein
MGGISVGAGDVSGDGVADIIVGAGAGALGGHVKVFDGATGAEVRSFFAFSGFTGGVSVASGDVTGDGVADIIVGAGAGAPGGHVKVFDGATGAEVRSFLAFPGYLGGVNVGSRDLNGDGVSDILVEAAALPHMKAFDGTNPDLLLSSFTFDPILAGGVSVS